MNLAWVEHHPQRVLQALRRGEFDAIEILGEADEKDFFELMFSERLLDELAQSMPSQRRKHEVPKWFILAANLSLKLHCENSFFAFERVVRCGGLLRAMTPDVAQKRLEAGTPAFRLWCKGFNHKNQYDRTTPCDQDTLRKAFKDVPAQDWLAWFNGPVQQLFQAHGFFDPAGIFIGDASYLFVPDNPAYEGSVVLWFDEHNHPVDYESLGPEQRRQAHRERCYKWVSLLHLRGQEPRCYVYAAAALVGGQAHESPVLYGLVDEFVRTVGPGVMRKLILDRGFIDGERISHCKRELGVDVLIPMKKKMDIWEDAWALGRTQPWEQIVPPPGSPPSIPPQRPAMLIRREAARQRTLAQRKEQMPPPPRLERMGVCPIKGFGSWTAATVPIHVVLMREEFSDGAQEQWGLMSTEDLSDPWQPRRDYHLRSAIEERHRQLKCLYDLTGLRSRQWNAVVAQVLFILLTYTLRQYQLWKRQQERLSGRGPDQMNVVSRMLREYVVIYYQGGYEQMPVVSFARELVGLEADARRQASKKLSQLEDSMLAPMENLRPD